MLYEVITGAPVQAAEEPVHRLVDAHPEAPDALLELRIEVGVQAHGRTWARSASITWSARMPSASAR